jgi:protein-S-isoprenylcysteine O-methyltransferase Ste14
MLVNLICRLLDRDSSWWGLSRFKPAPVQPYTSGTLLLICLVTGVPMAAVVYLAWYGFCTWGHSVFDDSAWLPRSAAWVCFVLNMLIQAVGCWAWNKRCARLAPGVFRYGHRRA